MLQAFAEPHRGKFCGGTMVKLPPSRKLSAPLVELVQQSRDADFQAEEFIPRTQQSFRLDQLAEIFEVSVPHLYNLIRAGVILVPAANFDRAPSRASILVPRPSIVAFVNRQKSSTRLKRKRAAAKSAATRALRRKKPPSASLRSNLARKKTATRAKGKRTR